MSTPFFSGDWDWAYQPSYPRHSPTVVRGVPTKRNPPKEASLPKVVSIPVHFVGSDNNNSHSKPSLKTGSGINPPEASLKIQKVFRGFLVRKSLKKIASIRREVEDIEAQISEIGAVDRIRREPKERLRINETLMTLLFKLDSVRGFDLGVRDFRRAVIKKAIALQEKVDALVVSSNDSDDKVVVQTVADQAMEGITGSTANNVPSYNDTNQMVEVSIGTDSTDDPIDIINTKESESMDENDDQEAAENVAFEPPTLMETNEIESSGMKDEVEDPQCVVKEIIEDYNTNPGELCEESVESCPFAENNMNDEKLNGGEEREDADKERREGDMEVQRDDETKAKMKEGKDDDDLGDWKENRRVVERMMEDNAKMMRMMSQLVERNEMQTRMLNSLNLRVSQLEKAFLCDKLRKSKKKKQAQAQPLLDGKQL